MCGRGSSRGQNGFVPFFSALGLSLMSTAQTPPDTFDAHTGRTRP